MTKADIQTWCKRHRLSMAWLSRTAGFSENYLRNMLGGYHPLSQRALEKVQQVMRSFDAERLERPAAPGTQPTTPREAPRITPPPIARRVLELLAAGVKPQTKVAAMIKADFGLDYHGYDLTKFQQRNISEIKQHPERYV
jgi:hypothetical protein